MVIADPRDLNDKALGYYVRSLWETVSDDPTVAAWGEYKPYRDEATRRLEEHAAMLGFKIEEVSNLPVEEA